MQSRNRAIHKIYVILLILHNIPINWYIYISSTFQSRFLRCIHTDRTKIPHIILIRHYLLLLLLLLLLLTCVGTATTQSTNRKKKKIIYHVKTGPPIRKLSTRPAVVGSVTLKNRHVVGPRHFTGTIAARSVPPIIFHRSNVIVK